MSKTSSLFLFLQPPSVQQYLVIWFFKVCRQVIKERYKLIHSLSAYTENNRSSTSEPAIMKLQSWMDATLGSHVCLFFCPICLLKIPFKVLQTFKLPKRVAKFLGFAHFYRCFIRRFSSITALIALLKEAPKRQTWNLVAEVAFTRLKQAFTTALALKPNRPLKVLHGGIGNWHWRSGDTGLRGQLTHLSYVHHP